MDRLAAALLAAVPLAACSTPQDGGDGAAPTPTPTVSFEVRGVVTDAPSAEQPDRFLMEVRGQGSSELGDDAIVVFDASTLRCASGGGAQRSPEAGDEVWLQRVGGISESDPPILHPEAVVLGC